MIEVDVGNSIFDAMYIIHGLILQLFFAVVLLPHKVIFPLVDVPREKEIMVHSFSFGESEESISVEWTRGSILAACKCMQPQYCLNR